MFRSRCHRLLLLVALSGAVAAGAELPFPGSPFGAAVAATQGGGKGTSARNQLALIVGVTMRCCCACT